MAASPQLRMVHRLREVGPPRALPEGYFLRLADETDAAELGRLLTVSFEDPWSEERVLSVLLKHDEVPKTFVIEFGGKLVATASYQIMPKDYPGSGWVHYVGGDPGHVGKGLGYIVTRQVLLESLDRKDTDTLLTTDDPRLPAIRTYMNLGFEPDMWHESHAERWEAIATALKQPAS